MKTWSKHWWRACIQLFNIYIVNGHIIKCISFSLFILWSFIVTVKVLAKTKKIQFKVSSTWNELIKHKRGLIREHFVENHFWNIQSMHQLNRLCLQKKNKYNLKKFTDENTWNPAYFLPFHTSSTLHLVMNIFPKNKIRWEKKHFREKFELLSHLKRIFMCNL